ncbi:MULTISPECIES: hypothetical protein [Vibrio]|jgi:hypothetical protein|uniref:Uncharacterized protein n=2 Tax=Vibrio TaxID=662 RepID=A0A837NV51_VIBSP|nr:MULTISPECIES: hypothetical protein [Vibrio]OED73642.1 hypothetical protein A143_03250 [Vibrio splendidus ZS-139]TVU66108.1 hypothetical protein FQP88_02130 [Vibrio atlanticus]TVU76997.1 hypothetical protein FQP87_07995 [Vibrio tasmaniensis]KPL96251.1 hypothetical protein AN168_02775 [Vibrio splendidus]MCF7505194.1 hypothetical protein [Vibrio sp. L3-7]
MKKLMIAVAVAGVMFSVNSFAHNHGTAPVGAKVITFQNLNDNMFANAGASDGAHIRMEGTVPQRCILDLQGQRQGKGKPGNGDITLTNMLDDAKNTLSIGNKKPVAKLRAWCNYGNSMEIDMTATPFKMITRYGLALGKERIDYTLAANDKSVFDTRNASNSPFGYTEGSFKVNWSGEHQQEKIAEVPLSITTAGAALARAGNYRSTVYVKLQAQACHRGSCN